MRAFRLIHLVLLLVVAATIGRGAYAGAQASDGSSSRAITLVHSIDYPPLFYIDEDSVSRGILVDYWRLWSDRTGIAITFDPCTWHDCLEKVARGEADVIPGIFYTADRDAVYDFSQAFMEIKTKIFVRKDLNAESVSDLSGRMLGVTIGDRCETFVKSHYPFLTVRSFDGFRNVVKAAAEGEIDAFAMDNPSALHYLEEFGLTDRFAPVKTIFVGKFCAAVAEGNDSLLINLNEGIEAINEDEISDILETWRPHTAGPLLGLIIRVILILAGILIIMFIIWHILILRGRIREHTCLRRAAERKYQTLVEHACEGIGVSQNDRYSYVSPSMTRITGYSEHELTGRDTLEFVHPEDHEVFREHNSRLRRGEEVSKTDALRMVTADGETRWIQLSSVNFEWDGESAILDFVTDITEVKRAEEAIKDADRQLRAIVETSPIPTIISRVDDGKIIYANDHLGALVGYGKEELIGQLTPDFYYDIEDRRRVVELLRRDGQLVDYEVRIRRRDGNVIWTVFSLVVGEFSGQKVIIGGLYDISERKVAEAALRGERNFVSAVLDTAAAMITVLDPSGRIVRFNAECERLTGYRFEDIQGLVLWDVLIDPPEKDMITERFRDILDSHSVVTGENYWKTKSGELRLISWSNTLLRDEDGAAEYVVAIGIDITEKRRVEQSLRLYREIYLNSKDSIVIVDDTGHYVESNPTHHEKSGYSAEELESKPLDVILAAEPMTEFSDTLRKTGAFRGELEVTTKSGAMITADLSAFAIRDEAGQVSGYAGIGRDITEQKEAQRALATRLRYEEGLAACSAALLEKTDVATAINRSLESLLRASESSRVYIFENFDDPDDGLCMRNLYEVCAEGIEPQLHNPSLRHAPYKMGFDRWREALSRGEAIAGVVRSFPGNERDVLMEHGIISILAIPMFIEKEWYGFIGFDDCTRERAETDQDIRLLRTAAEMIGSYMCNKRFEEALRVSEDRFRKLVENATDVIYSLDSKGNFSYLSPQFTRTSGHDVSEFLGTPVYQHMHPEDKEQTRGWVEAGMPEGESMPGGYQFRLEAKDGSWRWFVTNSSIIRDDDGNVVEAIGVAHDITEMRQLLEDVKRTNQELRDTQVQLVQSEKMASLGMLVAGVAHEINTPVGAITSMHDTLVRAVDKLKAAIEEQCAMVGRSPGDLLKYMKIIDEANRVIVSGSGRVTNIVKRLRSFARLDEAELKKANINEGIEDTLTIVHHELKHNVEVIREYGDIPEISCYPGQLNQVFLNLFVNAKQAIAKKGWLRIATSLENDRIIIQIADNGSGISDDVQKRIFDPGFTTKGVGVGTGLGLSICYQIIQAHHGDISVRSKVGEGTTFRITLPTNLDEILDGS